MDYITLFGILWAFAMFNRSEHKNNASIDLIQMSQFAAPEVSLFLIIVDLLFIFKK